jgi:hypothetical protein
MGVPKTQQEIAGYVKAEADAAELSRLQPLDCYGIA